MLQLKNIFKDYYVDKKPLKVLKDINLSFPEQQFVTILGPSGCGKTTLLNLIGGLDQYTSGDLIIEGKSTKEFKDRDWDAYRNHRVGFIFQTYNLITHLSVLENVELSLTLTGMSSKERVQKAKDALINVGLEKEMHKQINQLSGGQMQRVAIARALVNDPSIILADEPTGALDSKTSVQVMDIIKEISKDKLVIMVSHNEALAEKYSDRIIRMLDGVIVSDTESTATKIKEPAQKEVNKNTSMPFSMALKSSFKNIMTKKGRSIITSIAGSLGIIGIALVASVSTGFNDYIKRIEGETMASYPIGVFANSIELSPDSFTEDKFVEFPDEENLVIYDPSDSNQSVINLYTNKITQEFVDVVEKMKEDEVASSVVYNYPKHMKLITEHPTTNPNGLVKEAGSTTFNYLSPIAGGTFTQLFGPQEFVSEYYDLIGENSKYPTDANEIVLVIDRYNRVNIDALKNLGLHIDGPATGTHIPFEDIIGKKYKLIDNDDFYKRDPSKDLMVDTYKLTRVGSTINKEPITKTIEKYTEISNAEKKVLFEDETKGFELKVVGVLRPKAGTELNILSSGLAYTQALNEYMQTQNHDSAFTMSIFNNIVLDKTKIDSLPSLDNAPGIIAASKFYSPLYDVNSPDKTMSLTDFYNLARSNNFRVDNLEPGDDLVLTYIKSELEQTYTNIESIAIFPSDSQARKTIKARIDEFNKGKEDADKIKYSDMVTLIANSLADIVTVISTVLIIFTSISLVVSSVLIGIITYISVLERTKEIGVLRALGARKKDVARLFQAETFIIGLFAGLIGVFVAYAINIPLNIILQHSFPEQNLGNIANLTPLIALVLVAINVSLTMLSGLLPSSIAARKNPVEALRTE